VELGKPIFTNRPYTWNAVPEALRDRRFVLSPMEKTRVVCREPGVVYVLTPVPARNHDSVAEALIERGFVKARVPEFVLFLDPHGNASSGNVCTVYQKQMAAGEVLEIAKWGVVLF
jgi:hypothetical protein